MVRKEKRTLSFVLKSFVTKYPSGKTRRRMKRMKLEKFIFLQSERQLHDSPVSQNVSPQTP